VGRRRRYPRYYDEGFKKESQLAVAFMAAVDPKLKKYPEVDHIDVVVHHPIDVTKIHENDFNSRPGDLIGFECKLKANVEVIAQAVKRRLYSKPVNSVFVVVPATKFNDDFAIVARAAGVGVVIVSKHPTRDEFRIAIQTWGTRVDRTNDRILEILTPQAAIHSDPGVSGGPTWTRFKVTAHDLGQFVAAHPGCTVKEACAGIKHHYSTLSAATRNITKLLSTCNAIPLVDLRDGKLYAKPCTPASTSAEPSPLSPAAAALASLKTFSRKPKRMTARSG
jgi:hypothetical protein